MTLYFWLWLYYILGAAYFCRHIYWAAALSFYSFVSYWRYCLVIPPSSRQHLSSDDCLDDKREDYQSCSVLCCARQFCTMIHTHMWAVLKDECWFRFRFSFYVSLFRFSMLCVFLFRLRLFCSFVVWFCCVGFSFFSTKPRDWLGRTSPKWRILSRVGHKTLTQTETQIALLL